MKNLSACVIVKNEERNLPTWLKSMQGIADELVVVDTGSDDRTVAIAEAAGARVYHFPWRNDFAAAKNYAMDHAHGKWLLILDADEYIRKEDYPVVRQAIWEYEQQTDVIGFASRLVNIDQDNHGRFKNDGTQIRLVRNLPQLRYHGAVHEFLRYEGIGNKRMQFLQGLTIWHTGYSSGIIRKKSERDLAILLAAQKEHGEGYFYDGYLADCYYALENYEKAAYHAVRAARHPDVVAVGRESRPYAIWIQSLMYLGRSEEEVDAAIREAMESYPKAAEFFVLSGYDAWRRGNYRKAEMQLRESLVRYQSFLDVREGEQALKGDEMRGLLPLVLGYLAKIAIWRGRPDEAETCLTEALQLNPYQNWCTVLYFQLHEAEDDASFIAALSRFYRPQGDAAYLLGLLPERRGRVRLYYARQGGIALTEGEQYLAAGNLAAASAALTEDMQVQLGLGLLAVAHGQPLGALGALLPAKWRSAIAGQPGESEERIRRQLQRLQEGAGA